jgi:hypothetical protein
MSKERFLLWMLALIFTYQAGIFSFALYKCSTMQTEQISQVCPKLGERYDRTFSVMIATCLALLTGASFTKKGD